MPPWRPHHFEDVPYIPVVEVFFADVPVNPLARGIPWRKIEAYNLIPRIPDSTPRNVGFSVVGPHFGERKRTYTLEFKWLHGLR